MEKICAGCKIKQDINNFNKSKKESCGHVSRCKKCRIQERKIYNELYPGKQKEYQRNYRAKSKEKRKIHYVIHRDKIRQQARSRWHTNPEFRDRARNHRFKSSYGISLEEYNVMAERQKGLCLICKRPPYTNKKSDKLYVDHCHKTNKVRGLLCHKCNSGLGSFNDNPEFLKEAAKYLEMSMPL